MNIKVDIWRIDDAPKEGQFWVSRFTENNRTQLKCVHVPGNPNSQFVGLTQQQIIAYCLSKKWKCTLLETDRITDIAN